MTITRCESWRVGGIGKTAAISDCGRYRWWLHRSWSFFDEKGFYVRGKGTCCFVMLNPSTADGIQDDPTIRRCMRFAQDWGYDTLNVRNLFPFRATDPRELLRAADVTGGQRGDTELLTAMTNDLVIVAWGAFVPFDRDLAAMKLFECFPGKPIHCLGLTKQGRPRHPLYVRSACLPQLFRGPQD